MTNRHAQLSRRIAAALEHAHNNNNPHEAANGMALAKAMQKRLDDLLSSEAQIEAKVEAERAQVAANLTINVDGDVVTEVFENHRRSPMWRAYVLYGIATMFGGSMVRVQQEDRTYDFVVIAFESAMPAIRLLYTRLVAQLQEESEAAFVEFQATSPYKKSRRSFKGQFLKGAASEVQEVARIMPSPLTAKQRTTMSIEKQVRFPGAHTRTISLTPNSATEAGARSARGANFSTPRLLNA